MGARAHELEFNDEHFGGPPPAKIADPECAEDRALTQTRTRGSGTRVRGRGASVRPVKWPLDTNSLSQR